MDIYICENITNISFLNFPWSVRIGVFLLLFFTFCAVFAPWIAPYGESEVVGDVWEPIGGRYVFGTDQIGRDLLSRLIFGARNTISLALFTTACAFLFGSILGEQASIGKAIKLFPNRFVGFQLVDPTNPAAPDIVEDIVSKKLSGLLLFPALHHFFPDDPSCVKLYELARKFKLIVFVHIGVLKILIQEKLGGANQCIQEFGDAQRLGSVLSKFPEVSFIVPHFGCGQLDGLIEPARESRNLYLDTSSSNNWLQHNSKFSNLKELFENVLEEKAFGIERLLFGTDSTVFPRGWRKDIYEIQRKALDDLGVTSTDLSLLLNKNLEKLVTRF